MLAGYSAIANDSIQTVGTFISSNKNRPWWMLWLFIGGIFVVTTTYSWWVYEGDVSYQRLTSKGFEESPASFMFLQLAAPIFLLILTRMRMPVSTTFLLLSCFSTDVDGIVNMLIKSISGYGVAFILALAAWTFLSHSTFFSYKNQAHPAWHVAQWISSGTLWAVWIMQDAANIAVYLPRSLNLPSLVIFNLFIFFGLGVLFYLRGDRIQRVVEEKTDVTDIRSATIIDFVYATVLFFFVVVSVIPMSTTWVFIGLLAGREIAFGLPVRTKKKKQFRRTLRLIRKDLIFALIGLVVSLILAVASNPAILQSFFSLTDS